KRIEQFCNKVAAEALVPSEAFNKLLPTIPAGESAAETANKLARHFCVSDEVIARRLRDLNRISQSEYQALRHKYIEAWKASTKRQGDKKAGLPPWKRTATELGIRFASAVTEALVEGDITSRDATRLLKMDLSKLPELE